MEPENTSVLDVERNVTFAIDTGIAFPPAPLRRSNRIPMQRQTNLLSKVRK